VGRAAEDRRSARQVSTDRISSEHIVDLAGKKTVLSEGYWSLRGLSWSPDGEEVLFSASLSGGSSCRPLS
jgi:hypothetical protein